MTHGLAAALMLAALSPPPVWPSSVLRAVDAGPVQALADDAVRFSTEPQVGGMAVVLEIWRGGEADHWARARWLEGHPHRGWKRTGEWLFRVDGADYRQLAATVDALLARPNPRCTSGNDAGCEAITICGDGLGQLTERVLGGDVRRRQGACGDNHPNELIAKLLSDFVAERTGLVVARPEWAGARARQ